MKMKPWQLSLLGRFVALLALWILLPSYSGAWLIDNAFWDTGYSKLSQPLMGDNLLEIKALWYKADFVAEKAYFRLDTYDQLFSNDTVFQIGIDKAASPFNFTGGRTEVNDALEGMGSGVDTVLSIDMLFASDPRWMTMSSGTFSNMKLDETPISGAFAYTDGGTESIFEWAVPLSLLNDSAWITVYGASGSGQMGVEKGIMTEDFAGSLTVSTVPEPGTMTMAGVLAVLGGIRARLLRKKAQPAAP